MRAGGLAFCLKALDLSSWDSGAQGGAVDSLQDSLSRYSSAKACVQVSVLLAVGTLGMGSGLPMGVPSPGSLVHLSLSL